MVNRENIKFSINTLGCRLNHSESDMIARELISSGMKLVSLQGNPDLCILNTCTVTARSDSKTRQLIGRIRSLNQSAKIIVTGCFVKFNRAYLKRSGNIHIVENNQKEGIPAIAWNLFDKKTNTWDGLCEDVESGREKQVSMHSRPLVKIQDGCQQNCAYCIIPLVRGKYRSMGLERILGQIRYFEEQGFEEVVLTGVHIGKYGVDLKEGNKGEGESNCLKAGIGVPGENMDVFNKVVDGSKTKFIREYCPGNLSNLIKVILGESQIKRIRLSSIEVNELDDSLLEILVKNRDRIAPHLHIPLQSGSDSMLGRMGRPYTSMYFKNVVKKVRDIWPDVAITTDIIVGFPGEGKSDFSDTLEMVEYINFSKLHVFKYSARLQTKAAGMDGKVSEEVKNVRSSVLREMGDRMRKDYIKKNLSQKLETVCEKFHGDTKLISGTSGNYIKTYFLSGPKRFSGIRGKIVTIEPLSRYEGGILGNLSKTAQ
ncbi:MAG: radical SAM protein [Actinobacteria bacterium]|nr:radical SAM protein [Actinomycetota bacterium]